MTRRADEIRTRLEDWSDDDGVLDSTKALKHALFDIRYLLARNAALERVAQAARDGRDDTHWDTCPCDLCQALAALDAEGEKV